MRKVSLILCCISLLCIAACKPNEEAVAEIPAGVLTEEQLVPVLTDCYLAEAASGINVLNVPGPKFDSAYVFNPLKDHDIRKAQFDSSLAFYSKHPKVLKSIYERVLEKLSQIQAAKKIK
ncbi:MAG: DUF4296 domain-containing protein [Bacteroidetes bacterium]|nr:DUF4296 domain-containing protein [Bacteroidota bacterium]